MNSLITACMQRSRVVILAFLFILVAGVYIYVLMPKEREPDVQIPIMFVSMTHEGISPEDGERLLIKPMENELRSLESLKEMQSYAIEGKASIVLEFQPGFDAQKALLDVREKVDIAKVELPEDTKEPIVEEVNLSLFPVINIILTGNVPEQALILLAREMEDHIEALPNVLSVDIAGDREEVVEVIVEPELLQSYQLTLEELRAVGQGFNQLVAAGNLETGSGEYAVKIRGLISQPQELLDLPVKTDGQHVVKVSDIATLRQTFKQATGYARVGGKPSVVLEVSKRTGTNLLETIAQVKMLMDEAKPLLPPNVEVLYAQDGSNTIKQMLSDLQNNIILAILLVMFVAFWVVGVRSALLITTAIPGAFLLGILFLNSLNLTINIVVLFSLILSVGMLVDAAIVICEMANRKIGEGMKPFLAYQQATFYMKWPIIASTATTLIVFAPLLFWPGIVGQFMQYMPITLIATLSGSLLMAIIFIPTLGAVFHRRTDKRAMTDNIQVAEVGELDALTGFTGGYYRVLRSVTKHPMLFFLGVLSVLIGVYFVYVSHFAKIEFFPDIEPENSIVQIRARGNLSVEEKDKIIRQVEQRLFKFQDEIRVIYARSGNVGGSGQQYPEDTIGIITLEYEYWENRRKASEITTAIREEVADIGGVIITTINQQGGPKKEKPIDIELSGQDFNLLQQETGRVLALLSEMPEVIDIEDTRPVPAIEWNMKLNRELAAQFGVNVPIIGSFIKFITNGLRMTSYRPDGSIKEVDIMVRFPPEDRHLGQLDLLSLNTANGSTPLSTFVERVPQPKITTINRSNSKKVINIRAAVPPGVLASEVLKDIQTKIEAAGMTEGVGVRYKGDEEEQKRTQIFLRNAFVIALFCMALILIAQFNSIYYALVILSAVFLSTVGVLLGLIISGQAFGIVMCGVGVISLSGIVVNNNIILIDTYLKLRDKDSSAHEAVLRASVQRLRPILLTAGTTVLGLMPMVMGMTIDFSNFHITFGSPSSQWWRQLSTTIAGGLTFATVLTLLFTPSMILVGERFLSRGRE